MIEIKMWRKYYIADWLRVSLEITLFRYYKSCSQDRNSMQSLHAEPHKKTRCVINPANRMMEVFCTVICVENAINFPNSNRRIVKTLIFFSLCSKCTCPEAKFIRAVIQGQEMCVIYSVVASFFASFRFLWPSIVSKLWRERESENQQDETIRCLLSTLSQHV